ncbi:MAG: LPS-assembly protein LptD [Bacteroidetes bacterium HGW-Bacteroidetes-21]|nr:MAG: LPS-assembly protein LptD [Bacteroidetes bacterium HGW-Bacteroidetes-21]
MLNMQDSVKAKNNSNADSLDASVHYFSADSMKMNLKEKKVYLYNNAEIQYKEVNLKAGYIEMNFGKNEVYASGIKDSSGVVNGTPVFKDGDEEFESDWIRYNFKTKKGIISNVTTAQSGGFLHGEKVKRLPDGNICLKNGYYTTCDEDHPHYYINLTKAKVIPDDKIVSGPAYLVIEDLPVPLGIPFGFFPNKKGNTSGILIPEYGEENNRGFFLRNGGYYFAINDYVNLALTGDIYSMGSWGLNTLTNYKKRYKFNGNMNFSYSKLIIGEKESSIYQNQNTYWLRWSHAQDPKAHPNHTFNANVNMGSSSYNKYNSNINNNAYASSNRLRSDVQSNVSFNQRWSGTPFSLSANARHEQNFVDSTVSLSVPELNFTVSRIYPFKRKNSTNSNFLSKIGVSYSSNFKNTLKIREEELFTDNALKNFKNGIQHSVPVSTSMTLLKYFNLNPSLSFTSRWYFKSLSRYYANPSYGPTDTIWSGVYTDTINGFSHATDWQITVPLTTKLYGFYMMKNEKAKIQAMRHVMTPSVSFSYRPNFSDPKWNYYQNIQTDSLGNRELFSRFNGGSYAWTGIYGSPPSGKYGSMNFSLGNNLEMKVKKSNDTVITSKKISLLESFNLTTSYNMAADSLNWSLLNITARTNILHIITLNFDCGYDYYALDSLGRRYNKLFYDTSGKLMRFTRASLSAGININSDSFTSENKQKKDNEAEKQAAMAAGFNENYLADYVDFKIPWNLMIDYRISQIPTTEFNKEKSDYVFKMAQTLNFSGDLNLTPKWKISVTSGYDVESKSITYTSLNIYRDLHCWEMRISWIPLGFYKSYNFQLNVKASVLQDLKLNRRRNWTDNI